MATLNKFQFDKVAQKLEQKKQTTPLLIANRVKKVFNATFTKQAFDNRPWREVKRRVPGTPEYNYPKRKGLSRRTKPILVGSGKLRRSVNNSLRYAEWRRGIKYGVDTPYAQYHNEGEGKIPQRQFMGTNQEVKKIISETLRVEIGKIFVT